MWTKKELTTQDPSASSSDQPDPRQRFVPEEKIEIVRKTANSTEERDQLKAELEAQGFTVTVREPTGPDAEGEYYVATLFAEKREPVMVDTWAVEQEEQRLKKRDRKIDVTAKAGFWIIVGLCLIGLLYLFGPLIRACRALF
jgi:hypothetical protein